VKDGSFTDAARGKSGELRANNAPVFRSPRSMFAARRIAFGLFRMPSDDRA